MAKVSGSIDIERSPEVVFDFVADARNEPKYHPQMTAMSLVTEEPIGVGSMFAATLVSRGRPVTMTVEYTDFVRPSRIALVSSSVWGIKTVGAVSFAPSGMGTVMTWSWDIRLHGLANVASPIAAWIGRRQERATWGGLKQYLEAAQPSSE
jgi:hypothetical protein